MPVTFDLQKLAQPIQNTIDDLEQSADINQFIDNLRSLMIGFIEELATSVIQKKLLCPQFLADLKIFSGKNALRFNGYKETSIRLLSGFEVHRNENVR